MRADASLDCSIRARSILKRAVGGDGARTHSLAGGLPCWNEGSFNKHVAICVLTKILMDGGNKPVGVTSPQKKKSKEKKNGLTRGLTGVCMHG